MQGLHNIERSAFRKGEYVGYGHGAWRIKRGGKGWEGYSSSVKPNYITARTLAELSPILEAINNDHRDCSCMAPK